jgi:hypothetical protein
MKSLKYFFTLYLILGLLLTNCVKEEDYNHIDDYSGNCPPINGAYFDIKEINEFSHYYKLSDSSHLPLEDSAQIKFEDYVGLYLDFSTEFISERNQKSTHSRAGNLYALSCISNGDYGSKTEKYKNISIVTLNDFNDDFREGDTINDLLKTDNNQTIEELISDSNYIEQKTLLLKLIQAPSNNEGFKVKVFIKLNNGESYDKESSLARFD